MTNITYTLRAIMPSKVQNKVQTSLATPNLEYNCIEIYINIGIHICQLSYKVQELRFEW